MYQRVSNPKNVDSDICVSLDARKARFSFGMPVGDDTAGEIDGLRRRLYNSSMVEGSFLSVRLLFSPSRLEELFRMGKYF